MIIIKLEVDNTLNDLLVYLQAQDIIGEDIKVHNRWLHLQCCSIQQLCMAFPIQVGCNWLLNMGDATNEL